MASTGMPIGGAGVAGGSSTGSTAFLESTRTNVIVLQELEGLCWRRYTLAQIGYGLSKNPTQHHALLTAFARAIEAGYAATVVHKSSRSGTQSPHFGGQMDQQMDLYVFWQGHKSNANSSNTMSNNNTPSLELPAPLSAILTSIPQSKVAEEGCWDKGMSYVVRCLLMKATNCLVQAQLARGGYHRVGRYFVRTHSAESAGPKLPYAIAFTLNYFVHGDGRQLCAFVNARRRPPLARLSARHLSNGAEKTNVILCPFGLSGQLTGKALAGSESNDFLSLFAHTCPVVPSSSEPSGLPSVVEVAIAGGAVHTFYPTHSLLVVDDGTLRQDTNSSDSSHVADCQPNQSTLPTISPRQRRVPFTPNSTGDANGLGVNILDLMSTGTDITTHPSVLPSPNCACSVSLTGKRTNTSATSHSTSSKRPSFHRSCHLKAEEAVPSPLLSMSQANDEMSLLFPMSVAPPPVAPTIDPSNDDCRSTISTTYQTKAIDEIMPQQPAIGAVPPASSATSKTIAEPINDSTSITIAAPATSAASSSAPNGQLSPPINGHDIVPRKIWPSVHDREMLNRITTSFASASKQSGYLFGKHVQSHSNLYNDSSYILSTAFSRVLNYPNLKSGLRNDDLVTLFGLDSLSCMADVSPSKISAQDASFSSRHIDAQTNPHHHPHHHSSSHKSAHHQQHQASALAVLLDSPDVSEPLSVDRNLRGDNATLDILATLGNSNNRLGAELPDNIFDVDSDASDDSPGGANSAGNGSTAPNSLDAHFPTPPTSVETNAPPSLRGLTPAAATETDQHLQHLQQQQQQQLGHHSQQPTQWNVDAFSACETVFHPETSFAFVEGEWYHPLSQLSAVTNGEKVVTFSNSITISLRHEPSSRPGSKMLGPSPLKQSLPTPSLQREQAMSPLSFLNTIGPNFANDATLPAADLKSPVEPNNHGLSKNFEVLVPDNLVSLLLQMSDSVLDIHRDVNFDMAPLCACTNSPMRGVDWPTYLRSAADGEDSSMNADFMGSSSGADTPWPGAIADCSCGYSAVANRRFASFGCGLLRDDERELLSSNASLKTIMKYARNDFSSKNLDPALIRLIQKMCSVATPPIPFVAQMARLQHSSGPWTGARGPSSGFLKRMAHADKNSSVPMCRCRACFAESLELNNVFVSSLMTFLESEVMENVSDEECFFFHNWMNTGSCSSTETNCTTNDLFKTLSNVHPLLLTAFRPPEGSANHSHSSNSKHQRDSLQNGDAKAGNFGAGISQLASAGPLHLLSLFESGSDPVATAVPIPFVMASCEKEAIQLAPTALGPCWERNGLEPVAGAGRRLCYFSVRPSSLPHEANFDDEEQVETLALKFFINEVGRVMVDCRLASVHTPLVEASFPFNSHQTSQYVQKVPRMPIVIDSAMDTSPATPNRAAQHMTAQRDWLRTMQKMIVDSLTDREQVESSYDGCVCYVVVRDHVIAMQVLRLFSHLLDSLPSDDFRERVVLQMVPTSFAALSWASAQPAVQAEVRRLAFSIYTQLGSRWRLDRGERALTDTGPLPIMRDIILTESRLALAAALDRKPIKYSPENATGLWEGPLRWSHSPIAVLARLKDQQTRLAECCGQRADTTVVVFAAYCPTPDQRFLLVSLTDDCGYIVKTGVLALEQPQDAGDQQPPSGDKSKSRRPTSSKSRLRPPVARTAVERVWCWLLGAISHSSLAVPIRLVLTRLGRLGHGEARTWSALLSRQSLMQMSTKLQMTCNHCQALPSSEVPCVISSCLISLEPHPWLRLMSSTASMPVATAVLSGAGLTSDQATAAYSNNGGEFRSAGKLFACTGSAAYSSTHVFAFPTSAAIQAQTQAVADEVQDGDQWDLLFPADIDKDMLDIPPVASPSAGGGLMGFDDLGAFGAMPAAGSHQTTSRQNNAAGGWPRQSVSGTNGTADGLFGASTTNFFGVDSTATTVAVTGGGAAACGLLQQPLAVAFVVSSAPMGPSLPDWLCTIAKNAGWNDGEDKTSSSSTPTDKPSSLRAALHVHTASILPTAGATTGGLNTGGLGSGGSTSGGAGSGGTGGAGSGSNNMALQEHPLDSRRTVDVLRYAVEEHDALSWLAVDPATGQRTSCLPPHIVSLINLHHMMQIFSR